jgi:hypothetical protein
MKVRRGEVVEPLGWVPMLALPEVSLNDGGKPGILKEVTGEAVQRRGPARDGGSEELAAGHDARSALGSAPPRGRTGPAPVGVPRASDGSNWQWWGRGQAAAIRTRILPRCGLTDRASAAATPKFPHTGLRFLGVSEGGVEISSDLPRARRVRKKQDRLPQSQRLVSGSCSGNSDVSAMKAQPAGRNQDAGGWNQDTCGRNLDAGATDQNPARKFRRLSGQFRTLSGQFRTSAGQFRTLPENSGGRRANSGRCQKIRVAVRHILDAGKADQVVGGANRVAVGTDQSTGETNQSAGGKIKKQSEQFRIPAGQFRTPAEQFRTPAEQFRTPAKQFRTPAQQFRTPAGQFNSLPENSGGSQNNSGGRQGNSARWLGDSNP